MLEMRTSSNVESARLIEPILLFHDGDPHHLETSPLVCKVNQWTGFCMIGASVMRELS